MSPRSYDVVIIGAGPAGSMAAYHLASRGFTVAILEKESFPRYKPCGGGLTQRALSLFPFDLSPVIETTIHQFRFTYKYGKEFTHSSEQPLMVCTMRDKLDKFILDQAIAKGAEFLPETRVLGFTENFSKFLVHTAKGEFEGTFVIGADGASSLTARTFQLTSGIKKGIAIESEVTAPPDELERFKETVCLDWGTFIRGYAWMFPKKDHFSIGVGGPGELSKYLKVYFLNFLKSLHVREMNILSFRTYPIPYRTSYGRLQSGKVLLVGDAAGLTDPMTGEGIYFAAKSGTIAAETIISYFDGDNLNPFVYRERVENELVAELMGAIPLLKMFNAAPSLIHNGLSKRPRMWRGFCKVLTGDLTYPQIPEKMGRYGLLWKPMVHTASMVELLKKANFKLNTKNTE